MTLNWQSKRRYSEKNMLYRLGWKKQRSHKRVSVNGYSMGINATVYSSIQSRRGKIEEESGQWKIRRVTSMKDRKKFLNS